MPAQQEESVLGINMQKQEAKKRIEKLRELIDYYRYAYHVLDKEEISSSALDSLKKELFDLERDFPEFVTSDSPTQRIGGKPLDEFEKFITEKHNLPIVSYDAAIYKEYKDIPTEKECFYVEDEIQKEYNKLDN